MVAGIRRAAVSPPPGSAGRCHRADLKMSVLKNTLFCQNLESCWPYSWTPDTLIGTLPHFVFATHAALKADRLCYTSKKCSDLNKVRSRYKRYQNHKAYFIGGLLFHKESQKFFCFTVSLGSPSLYFLQRLSKIIACLMSVCLYSIHLYVQP